MLNLYPFCPSLAIIIPFPIFSRRKITNLNTFIFKIRKIGQFFTLFLYKKFVKIIILLFYFNFFCQKCKNDKKMPKNLKYHSFLQNKNFDKTLVPLHHLTYAHMSHHSYLS